VTRERNVTVRQYEDGRSLIFLDDQPPRIARGSDEDVFRAVIEEARAADVKPGMFPTWGEYGRAFAVVLVCFALVLAAAWALPEAVDAIRATGRLP
jgi:hypothetical protein